MANSIREKMIANFILTALLCLTVSYSTIQKPARDANGTDGETQAWTSWHTSKVATQSRLKYKGKGTVKEAHDNYYRYVEGKA